MLTLKLPISINNSGIKDSKLDAELLGFFEDGSVFVGPVRSYLNEPILHFMKEQNKVYNCAYSLMKKYAYLDLSQKEVRELITGGGYNFHADMDSWFIQSAIHKAESDINADLAQDELLGLDPGTTKRVFGGKALFLQRSRDEITNEEYKLKRLQPIYLIGEATKHSNRKFEFYADHLVFKPNKDVQIRINLPHNGLRGAFKPYYRELVRLSNENGQLPITVSLDQNHIYIAFDESFTPGKPRKAKESRVSKIFSTQEMVVAQETTALDILTKQLKSPILPCIKGRYMGLDVNPNWIGVSFFAEDKKLLHTVLYDLSLISQLPGKTGPQRRYRANKLRHEIREIGWELNRLCNYFRIQYKFIEDLSFANKDAGNGGYFNLLVRNLFLYKELFRILKKPESCKKVESRVLALNAMYSSTIGNLMYPNHPDAVAASMEIARRGIECRVVDAKSRKEKGELSKFFPPLIDKSELMRRWKDASEWVYSSWIDLHKLLEKMGVRCRSLLSDSHRQSFSFNKIKNSLVKKVMDFVFATASFKLCLSSNTT